MDIPAGEILVGVDEAGAPVTLRLDRANRHGLVAGATGTGKTVTLQGLAEAFSAAGTSVFAADVKGDLSGISQAATLSDKLKARADGLGVTIAPAACPTVFWDLFGAEGHPVRATVSDIGPVLLARLFQLSDVQAGVLQVVFTVADKEGLLLLDLDDLQAAVGHVAENAAEYGKLYGNVAPASAASIQRAILQMRSAGGDKLFGEPALKLSDLMRTDMTGRGIVSVLAADKLINSPGLYAVFLLWLMSELFEALPEVGDPDKPKLVFFFDEAHLLFNDAPKVLLDKVEQVVRLIRSKGVGIYFVTQNPADVPETVLAQLGNRIEHGLRAYTPSEQAALKAAAQSFRANPAFDTAEAIQALGVELDQQRLLVGDLDLDVRHHRVGQLARVLDLGELDGGLGGQLAVALGVVLELGDDRTHQRLDLLPLGHVVGNRLDRRRQMGTAGVELAQPGARAALDQHAHGAVGQLQQLQHGGGDADLVQVGAAGIVLGGVELRDQENLLVGRHRRLQRGHRLVAPDEQRDDHVREDDDVPQRQDGEGLGHGYSVGTPTGRPTWSLYGEGCGGDNHTRRRRLRPLQRRRATAGRTGRRCATIRHQLAERREGHGGRVEQSV